MKNAYIREKNVENLCHNRNAISKLMDTYFDDMRKHNYSEKTICSYDSGLRRFLYFLGVNGVSEIQDVTLDLLEKYRVSSLDEGLKTGTVAMLLRVVKTFFKYLESEGIIFDNPTYSLKLPKVEKKMQYVPSEEDMIKLIAQPYTVTPTGIRDRAILEVAYSTGIRLEELTGLKLSSVDLKNKVLRVMGKGKKERIVPLTKAACKWLENYVSGSRQELLKYNLNEDALWIGNHKKSMSHAALGVRIGEYSKEAGIRRISPHAIRRACATHMLRNGAHPVQIQMLLGHSDLSTLSRYLSITLEDMKKSHGKSRAGR